MLGRNTMKNRSLRRTTIALSLAVVGGLAGPAAGAKVPIRDNGVDPYHLGKGDYVWIPSAGVNNNGFANLQQLIDFEKSKGMKYLVVKSSQSDAGFTGNFTSDLVTRCHKAGLKIFAFPYAIGGAYLQTDINQALAIMAVKDGDGVPMDGYVIDAESEWSGQYANAETLCKAIRAKYPTRFLAHAPYPMPGWNAAFPYKQFGKYCDAVFAQAYWYLQFDYDFPAGTGTGGKSPEYMVRTMSGQWDSAYARWSLTADSLSIKPLAPTGQAFPSRGASPPTSAGHYCPAAELARFCVALNADTLMSKWGGYGSVNWFDAAWHTKSQWDTIGKYDVCSRGCVATVGLASRQAPEIRDRLAAQAFNPSRGIGFGILFPRPTADRISDALGKVRSGRLNPRK